MRRAPTDWTDIGFWIALAVAVLWPLPFLACDAAIMRAFGAAAAPLSSAVAAVAPVVDAGAEGGAP